jgi:integrase
VLKHWGNFSDETLETLRERSPLELKELFGKFANYLYKLKANTGKPSWQTAMNYLSSLSQVWKRSLFQKEDGIFQDTNWYHGVRTILSKKYTKLSQDTGVPLVESPDNLTTEYLGMFSDYLIGLNSYKSLQNRALVILMWHLLGRASEVTYIRFKDIAFDSENHCLNIYMQRTKGVHIGKRTPFAIFLHRDSWKSCPIHALSSQFLFMEDYINANDFIYDNIPRGDGVSKHINHTLKAFTTAANVEANLTSHSSRHGAASAADSNHKINITWIIERGEWILDRINTVFEYIMGGSKNDRQVARVLSGWPLSEQGGILPNYLCVPENQRIILHQMADYLFPMEVNEAVRHIFLLVQLLHFKELHENLPADNLILRRIGEVAHMFHVSLDLLDEISEMLKADFVRNNLGSILTKDLPESISQRLDTLSESVVHSNIDVQKSISSIRDDIMSVKDEIRDLKNNLREEMAVLIRSVAPMIHRSVPSDLNKENHLNSEHEGQVGQDELHRHSPQQEVCDMERTISKPFPRSLDNIKGMTIQTAFFKYFEYDLGNCDPPKKRSKKGKSTFARYNAIVKNYQLCCILEPRLANLPEPTSKEVLAFRRWQDSVRGVVSDCFESIKGKLEEHNSISKMNDAGSTKSVNRKITMSLQASIKRMRGLVKTMGSVIQNVEDDQNAEDDDTEQHEDEE